MLAKAKLVWGDRKRRCTTSDNVGEHVGSSGVIPCVPDLPDVHDRHQLQGNDFQKVNPLLYLVGCCSLLANNVSVLDNNDYCTRANT